MIPGRVLITFGAGERLAGGGFLVGGKCLLVLFVVAGGLPGAER